MTTMRRRRVLQAGAALAMLPLSGCTKGPLHPESPSRDLAGEGDRDAVNGTAVRSPSPEERTAGPPRQASAPAPSAGPAKPDTSGAPVEPARSDLSRVIARVGKNHGHVFVVAIADVQAGVDKIYDLSGKAAHPHAVTLTAEQMRALRTGEVLRVRSSESSLHSHRLWVRCAPAMDPPEWVTACKASFTGKDEHELVIPAADLASTEERTYDVQGIAGHSHQLTISAADFETLRKGGPLTRHTSRLSDDSHMHQVAIERLRQRS